MEAKSSAARGLRLSSTTRQTTSASPTASYAVHLCTLRSDNVPSVVHDARSAVPPLPFFSLLPPSLASSSPYQAQHPCSQAGAPELTPAPPRRDFEDQAAFRYPSAVRCRTQALWRELHPGDGREGAVGESGEGVKGWKKGREGRQRWGGLKKLGVDAGSRQWEDYLRRGGKDLKQR